MHASWLFGGYRELADGEPVRLANGLPRIHGVLVPRSRAEYLGNWHVIGLRATGSIDFAVPVQEVPEAYTFSTLEARPLRGGPLLRLGPSGLTAIGHAAWATGVARTALDELRAVAASKRRLGRKGLIDDPWFQHMYARHEALLGSARAYALQTLTDLGDAAEADAITDEVRARARLATSHACDTARDVVTFAFQQSGSTGLRNGSVLQRCYRDISAGEQHVFTDHNTFRDASLALLGIAPPTLQL
jgi:alkylation response protein AidB-like acyl-CoA dehydrogenase